MKGSSLILLSRHRIIVTSIIIGIFITSGAFFSTKYSNQIAAVTAGTCYLQSEVSTKEAEKLNLLSQASSTAAEIQITEDAIVSNWSALTTANAQITKLTPTIISDYAIQAEKTKVDTLYTQLSASKAIDALYLQIQTASTSRATAKATYTALYPKVQAEYASTTRMLARVNAAKISKSLAIRNTYPALLSQYNIELAKYNALNAQYKAALTQYNTYTSQYTTLSRQYTTQVAQFKTKYSITHTTTTTATLQAQYDTLNASYQKLVSDNEAIKTKITTLNNDKLQYTNQDAILNQKVKDFSLALSTLKNKILDADTVISVYRGNICPRTETDAGLASIPPNIRACNDNIDNDRNGLQDCDDLDCKGTVACQVMAREMPTLTNRVVCNDGLDNDRDGAIDCEDEDCQEAKRQGGDDEFCTGESVGGGGGTAVYGCTGAGADNVNPAATIDDGSCTYSNGGTTGNPELDELINTKTDTNPSLLQMVCEQNEQAQRERASFIEKEIYSKREQLENFTRIRMKTLDAAAQKQADYYIKDAEYSIKLLLEVQKYAEHCAFPSTNPAVCSLSTEAVLKSGKDTMENLKVQYDRDVAAQENAILQKQAEKENIDPEAPDRATRTAQIDNQILQMTVGLRYFLKDKEDNDVALASINDALKKCQDSRLAGQPTPP